MSLILSENLYQDNYYQSGGIYDRSIWFTKLSSIIDFYKPHIPGISINFEYSADKTQEYVDTLKAELANTFTIKKKQELQKLEFGKRIVINISTTRTLYIYNVDDCIARLKLYIPMTEVENDIKEISINLIDSERNRLIKLSRSIEIYKRSDENRKEFNTATISVRTRNEEVNKLKDKISNIKEIINANSDPTTSCPEQLESKKKELSTVEHELATIESELASAKMFVDKLQQEYDTLTKEIPESEKYRRDKNMFIYTHFSFNTANKNNKKLCYSDDINVTDEQFIINVVYSLLFDEYKKNKSTNLEEMINLDTENKLFESISLTQSNAPKVSAKFDTSTTISNQWDDKSLGTIIQLGNKKPSEQISLITPNILLTEYSSLESLHSKLIEIYAKNIENKEIDITYKSEKESITLNFYKLFHLYIKKNSDGYFIKIDPVYMTINKKSKDVSSNIKNNKKSKDDSSNLFAFNNFLSIKKVSTQESDNSSASSSNNMFDMLSDDCTENEHSTSLAPQSSLQTKGFCGFSRLNSKQKKDPDLNKTIGKLKLKSSICGNKIYENSGYSEVEIIDLNDIIIFINNSIKIDKIVGTDMSGTTKLLVLSSAKSSTEQGITYKHDKYGKAYVASDKKEQLLTNKSSKKNQLDNEELFQKKYVSRNWIYHTPDHTSWNNPCIYCNIQVLDKNKSLEQLSLEQLRESILNTTVENDISQNNPLTPTIIPQSAHAFTDGFTDTINHHISTKPSYCFEITKINIYQKNYNIIIHDQQYENFIPIKPENFKIDDKNKFNFNFNVNIRDKFYLDIEQHLVLIFCELLKIQDLSNRIHLLNKPDSWSQVILRQIISNVQLNEIFENILSLDEFNIIKTKYIYVEKQHIKSKFKDLIENYPIINKIYNILINIAQVINKKLILDNVTTLGSTPATSTPATSTNSYESLSEESDAIKSEPDNQTTLVYSIEQNHTKYKSIALRNLNNIINNFLNKDINTDNRDNFDKTIDTLIDTEIDNAILFKDLDNPTNVQILNILTEEFLNIILCNSIKLKMRHRIQDNINVNNISNYSFGILGFKKKIEKLENNLKTQIISMYSVKYFNVGKPKKKKYTLKMKSLLTIFRM